MMNTLTAMVEAAKAKSYATRANAARAIDKAIGTVDIAYEIVERANGRFTPVVILTDTQLFLAVAFANTGIFVTNAATIAARS